MRVIEKACESNTGRQRSANEDAYFVAAPMFAVADGMGGAQAGEVASRIAAESFEGVPRGGESPEAYLRGIAEAANERIHSLAQADSSRSGMGTTLTAALVEGDEVSIAHVGDSRAYRFREGELKLLTSDHSLVAELQRQGRLTHEEAEEHPQRSIITRALGPEPAVEVDTMTYRARPGDVYLLCSDGLTSMLRDDAIQRIMSQAPDLDTAVTRLIAAANEAGGRDNITVVAFRLAEEGEPAVPVEGATLVGPTAAEADLTAERIRSARARESASLGGAAQRAPVRRRGAARRRVVKVTVLLLVIAGVVTGAILGARQVYFLGTDSAGRLALYRGLPYDLPLGVSLYSEVYSAPVQVSAIPGARRTSATNHTLRSHDDAVSLLEDLQTAATPALPAGGGGKRAANQPGGGGGGGSGGGGGAGKRRSRS